MLWASGNFDLYLSEIRLSPTFDLSCFFTYGGSAWFGGSDSESLLQLCNAALENSGNYYDLFRTAMVRGLICPIMFRVNALYATRGVLSNCTPALSTLLYCNSGVTAADILSETAYEVSDVPADPLEDEAIPLPGEEQENSGGISETGSDPDSQTGNDGQLPEEQPSEEPDSQNPDGEVSGETPEDALEGEPSTPETLPDGASDTASGQTDPALSDPSGLPVKNTKNRPPWAGSSILPPAVPYRGKNHRPASAGRLPPEYRNSSGRQFQRASPRRSPPNYPLYPAAFGPPDGTWTP